MTEKCISSLHVQKLGHPIQEIRERALYNISAKLDHGFVYDNDLARSREILTKLLEWFLLEPCTKQELVFSLIKRILQSESGRILLGHCGTNSLKTELKQLRTYIEPKYYPRLEEILRTLDQVPGNIVPPLETDVPLSYRTGQSDVGTTATTIEGFIHEDTSASQRDFYFSPRELLRWQFLIEPDRHVLQSIENSLKNPPQPASLLHSADFFANILLQDFPAEVFLQRPSIVLTFHDLLNDCPSTRVTNSILQCLIKLTKALEVRVNHNNDPCLCGAKEHVYSQTYSRSSTPDSTSRRAASGQSEETERPENYDYLKTQQMSFPRYCLSSFKCVFKYLCVKPETIKSGRRKFNQKGVNLALVLLDELIKLLELVVEQNFWTEESQARKQLNEVLVGYGAALEYFRLEATSDDSNINNRVMQLCFLHNCTTFLTKLVPLSQTGLILPRNLKNALASSLIDVTLAKLYPELHSTLLDYVQSFRVGPDSDSLVKYHETNKICDSMTCAVQFLRQSKSLSAFEGVSLAAKALPSLEFHRNLMFIKQVVELCVNKLPLYPHDEDLLEKFEFVILKLLAHGLEEVREETYKLCQRRIIAAIGPKFNQSCAGVPGAQILFLLRTQVLIEISCHGVTSSNLQIRNCAEDILIHIIKCKILVSDDIWNKVVVALMGALPMLLCHSDKQSSLGRGLLNLIDPDTAQSLHLPKNEVVKGNIHALFNSDSAIREEGFSRLCWLLASQTDSKEMLPRLNNLYDKALPNVCQNQRTVDINRTRATQHFYQPSSLQQVIDLLKSPNVEPVIRRSALTQASVMMEDPLLHSTFIENDGVGVVLTIIRSALLEKNYIDYPDSVIPAISVLKNVCLSRPSARQELSSNIDVFYNVLRSLFMFFTEDKSKHDAVCLLFLLIFNDFIKGSPSKGNFSVPLLVLRKLRLPFSCQNHWEISQHFDKSLFALVTSDKWCLSSIQIQWNSEIFGGLDKLLSWNEIVYDDDSVVDILRLSEYDLRSLKASNLDYCTRKYLVNIQNGTLHDNVIDSINKLATYVYLWKDASDLLTHPWEATFSRFLKLLPSSEEDAKLLGTVLKFLKLLVPFYKASDVCWVSQQLKDPSTCLLDLICLDPGATEDFKELNQDLLELITLCACQEPHFLDYYTYSNPNTEIKSWGAVTDLITSSLNFSDSTHFYNLAYVDSLLGCLVHLTASLGWTSCKPGGPPKKILNQMVKALCELTVVFQCGKGATATISVMGLSITRNVILILNHLVAEIHNSRLKNWERCFMEVDEEGWVKSFMVLWSSRDVLVRAGAIQLFAGLSSSPLMAIYIVNELKNDRHGIWQNAIAMLMDPDEASIVRENCAFLLANFIKHTSTNKSIVSTSLIPKAMKKVNAAQDKDDVGVIYELFDEYQFYNGVISVLNRLYTNHLTDFETSKLQYQQRTSGSSSSSRNGDNVSLSIVTPSLVKSHAILLLNLLGLDEDRLICKLENFGLVKLFFKCICNPSMNVSDTRKLSLYCEIMEMDIAICVLLNQTAQVSPTCLGTLLHTKDCLTVTMSLLNPSIYHTHLPQLIYLRNRLWSEIFKLVSILTTVKDDHTREALQMVSQAIGEGGQQAFVETLCEAVRSLTFNELQSSALLSLSSLLRVESHRAHHSPPSLSSESSLKNLLDTVRTTSHTNLGSTRTKSDRDDIQILENVFFEKDTKTQTGFLEEIESPLAGAEICKILINLYDLCNLRVSKDLLKKKSIITASLSSILCVSQEAKKYAYKSGLCTSIVKQLKECYVKLSLESVDCLKRLADKKRVCPILSELDELVGLITNFMVGNERVKNQFAELGLSDLMHKLWVWFSMGNTHLIDVLKMICTFTTDCPLACQSLTLTSSVAGSGPRKVPSKISLLHAAIGLVEKEMDLVSKTHDLHILELSFIILKNCCSVIDCRILFCKSALMNSISRLHPAITKKQKPWDCVEFFWLEFLETFSLYPEGQSCVAKVGDVFDLLLALTCSSKSANRMVALSVLRNITFYQPNRPRLLTSGEFLNLLKTKLENGSREEKATVVSMMWALAANNQKAKIVFKAAQLDTQLQQVLKHYQLSQEFIDSDHMETMRYVLNMIRDGYKNL